MEKPRMLAFMGFLICVFVHWNARMTEMERSGIEVVLVFAVILWFTKTFSFFGENKSVILTNTPY